jgi:hypothetical protein
MKLGTVTTKVAGAKVVREDEDDVGRWLPCTRACSFCGLRMHQRPKQTGHEQRGKPHHETQSHGRKNSANIHAEENVCGQRTLQSDLRPEAQYHWLAFF